MAEPLRPVEERLLDLAPAIAWPPSPALRAKVLAAIAEPPAASRERVRVQAGAGRRRLRLAAAVAALLAATVALVPPLRTAVAGFLGLRGVVIQQQPSPPTLLPTPPPSGTPAGSATPVPLGGGLNLGDPIALPAAAGALAFVPLLPAALPAPDAAFVRHPPSGGALSLVYAAAPGRPPAIGDSGVSLLITEFRGDLVPDFLQKFVGPDATVVPIQVGADPGYWISGAPHTIGYNEQPGGLQTDDLRLATDTLVWQHGNLLLRVEATQSEAQALAIALSMR